MTSPPLGNRNLCFLPAYGTCGPNPGLLTNTHGSSLLPGWPRNNQLTVLTASPRKAQGPSHPFEAEGKLNHWKETELLRSSPLWKMYMERSSAPANDLFSAPLPTTKKKKIAFLSFLPRVTAHTVLPASIPFSFPCLQQSTCSAVSLLCGLP